MKLLNNENAYMSTMIILCVLSCINESSFCVCGALERQRKRETETEETDRERASTKLSNQKSSHSKMEWEKQRNSEMNKHGNIVPGTKLVRVAWLSLASTKRKTAKEIATG